MHVHFNLIVLMAIITASCAQVTLKKNPILSRKKRYLVFPEGSNFVTTMSYVKAVMVLVPRLVNVLGECDVPFKLPSDFRLLKGTKAHYRQRREIYTQLKDVLNEHGLNGTACIKRIICDAQGALPPKGKSLMGDLLAAILTFTTDDPLKNDFCCTSSKEDHCQVDFLNHILGGLSQLQLMLN